MATHDYVIDNSTGANVRSDLNNVLQAILTNNSSSSSPSTTAAYMWWADTTNGVLKIRNSANDGWVELLQLDGTLTLEDGSASTPALAFRDDLNTGIFSSAADTFNIATAGVERIEFGTTECVVNDAGSNTDFRIEGDSEANLFFLDAGNDRIGIGTNSPSTLLHISDSQSSGGVGFTLHNSDSSAGTTPYCFISAILNPSRNGGEIRFGREGTYGDQNSADSFMAFYTSANDTNTERIRIDSSGNLLHGVSASEDTTGNSGTKLITAGDLQIDGDQKALVYRSTASTAQKMSGIQWWNETAAGVHCAIFGIREAVSAGKGALGFYTSANVDTSANNGEGDITERLRISSDGNMFLGLSSRSFPKRLNIQGSSGAIIALNNNDTTSFAADTNTSIEFAVNTGNTGNQTGACEIRAFKENGTNGDNSRGLSFFTGQNGGSPQKRLVIEGAGTLYHRSDSTTNASLTLKKNSSGADSIDYLQCRDSSNALKMKIGGNGGISNFQSNDANLSDETMKKNIVDCESIIEKFKQWKLRKFNYNSEADGTSLTYGVIAQEVETIHSDLVNADFPVDDGNGNEVLKKTVKDHQLMMLGFKALQEAIAKIEVLETKVAALEAA